MLLSGIPRRVYYSFTHLKCEGEELDMTASFVSVPGPFITWYKQPDIKNYVYYEDFRGNWNTSYYTSRYHVQIVTSSTFGTYMVGAENSKGVSNLMVLVQINRKPNCTGNGKSISLLYILIYIHSLCLDYFC